MFENILYATDFSESPLMLPCVGVIGKTKKIHLLHVVDENVSIDPKLIEPQMVEAKQFMEDKLRYELNRSIEADVHLMTGVPGREICGVANKVNASLIVTNYHKPGGAAGSATVELIRNCDRNVLAMTKLASDAVDQSTEAMDRFCTHLFRKVLCPVVSDASATLSSLRSIKDEVSLGTVVFLSFSDSVDLAKLVKDAEAQGIHAESIVKKGTPRSLVISASEEADVSIILVDGRSEMGLALSVVGESPFPMLVLK